MSTDILQCVILKCLQPNSSHSQSHMVKQESCTKKQSHGRSATGGGGSTALPTWELATKDVHIELNNTKPLVKLLMVLT